ncbi:MAG: fumarylacetoacetate hydrolase family protein [Bryobacteraceae bacterium]
MDIEQLAQRQLSDYDRHQPGSLFQSAIKMSIPDAYALQRAVVLLREARGEAVAGYKIGCVSRAVQDQLGLDRPVFGHVFETEMRRSGVVLDPAHFEGLAIEGELAVRMARDIPSAEWLLRHPEEAVCSGFAVIELHNYVFRSKAHSAQELIANNAIHAGVIVPASEPPLSQPDVLISASITVSKNGSVLGSADGTALPGGPLGGVVRLVEHLAAFGCILRRGQIVLTGSPLPLYPVAPGDGIQVSGDGSQTLSCLISRPN